MGEKSVVSLKYNTSVEEITAYQERMIFPVISKALNGSEKILLDFGCGTGRFTRQLARLIGGRAIGADPIMELLDMARQGDPINEYVLISNNRIPIDDASVDAIWICLVMGGIPETQLTAIVQELKRVLRPNGLVLLIENTSALPNSTHWTYRTRERYQEIFDFARLTVSGGYQEVDEDITIFTGRK